MMTHQGFEYAVSEIRFSVFCVDLRTNSDCFPAQRDVAKHPVNLTPWSRVLDQLTVHQLIKAFYGSRWFITVFVTARHWRLS